MMNFGNGDEYRGGFKKDLRSGFGIYCAPGKYAYAGHFDNNLY